MTDTILSRFHGALVEALRERDPDHLARPFTVAEIYQDLVPYGAYRDELGVEMNGDYEHALLRLLAGEGDFVEMESEHALREIRDELESVNPNTGLYREFAAVDVRLNPTRISAAGPALSAVENGTEPEQDDEPGQDDSVTELLSIPEPQDEKVVPLGAFGTEPSPTPGQNESLTDTPSDQESEADPVPISNLAPDVCQWCRETLPKREKLNFCPFCGTDVKLVPCASCGEALEPDWRFCIACGTRSEED